jgi:hypothetical protein
MMGVIFRSEEKRWRARMEKEASLIHQEAMNHLDEPEEFELENGVNPDEASLEELLRIEEEELLALLAARDEAKVKTMEMTQDSTVDMEDITMTDIEFAGGL